MNNILFPSKDIKSLIKKIASTIDNDYSNDDTPLVLVVVLKGAYMFASDLTQKINKDCYVEFIKVSSYGDAMETSGTIKIDLELQDREEYYGSNMVIVEDIVDTGTTVKYLKQYLNKFNPKSIKVASMLWKNKSDIKPEYFCFEVQPDDFVVGRGLDYKGRFRGLKNIYKL